MLRRIGWRVLLIVVVAICYFVYLHFNGKSHLINSQTQSSPEHPLQSEVHFTGDQVSSIMYREGVNLSPLEESGQTHDLGGIHPSLFKVNTNNSQRLYIYEFPSLNARQKISDQMGANLYSSSPFEPTSTKPAYIYREFTSWNVLFIQEVPIKYLTVMNKKQTAKLTDLEPLIFHAFNGGKTNVYSAENADWRATFTYNYYEHWWKDKNGHLQSQLIGNGEFVASYKKKLPIKNVLISAQIPSGEESIESTVVDKKTTKLNVYDITQAMGTFEPTMSFQWDGKLSSLILDLRNNLKAKK